MHFRNVETRLFLAAAILGFLMLAAPALNAQSPAPSPAPATSRPPFSLWVVPSAELPLGTYADYYSLGGSLQGSVEYAPEKTRPFYFHGAVRYALQPLRFGETPGQAVSSFSLMAGAGIDLPIVPWLAGRAFAAIGGYYGSLNGPTGLAWDVNFLLSGGAALRFILGDSFSVSAGCSADYLHGISFELRPFVGASYAFGDRGARVPRIFMEGIQLENVFPVFKAYYDTHPVGHLTLVNREDQDVTDVKVNLFAPAYMDAPKECASFPRLGRGEKRLIDLEALFNDKVLDITEGTKALVQVEVEYRCQGQPLKQAIVASLRLYDRNAMTWTDDRRVAAFVTAKDPLVLAFAKDATGVVRELPARSIDRKLNAAMSIHESLRLHGVHYVSDPNSSLARASPGSETVDFLQFPRQTLAYKAGDCDDLSILYCALLESVGIETAFITVPGHIFMAFAVDSPPSSLGQDYAFPTDLIIAEGKAWVPVEATIREDGILEAWQRGAQEWRENQAAGKARLLPVHDAWSIYEPVGLTGAPTPVQTPDEEQIRNAVAQESRRFVEREISARQTALNAELQKSPERAWKIHNKLGVLYAQFGRLDQATREFELCGPADYLPALMNLGNLCLLQKDWEGARGYYEQALRIGPETPGVLLGLARVSYEQGLYPVAAGLFSRLQELDANLAAKFPYLGGKSNNRSRAAAEGEREEVMVWVTD
jgi:hypothetical protein